MNEQHAAKLKIRFFHVVFTSCLLFSVSITRMLQSLNAPPAIPIIEVVTADVHSLLKTYPDPYLNPEKTVIHFARCTAISDLLMKRVIIPQQNPYRFSPVPIITKWLSRRTHFL